MALNHIKSIIETSTGKYLDDYIHIDRDIIYLKHHAEVDIIELQESLNLLKREKNNTQKYSKSLALFQALPENICAGFYDDWIINIKGNIEHQILNICESLLKQDLDKTQKITILKTMIKFNPLEESYYEKLISLLKETGSRETSYYLKKLKRLSEMEIN